jgi:hypothetical protein
MFFLKRAGPESTRLRPKSNFVYPCSTAHYMIAQ